MKDTKWTQTKKIDTVVQIIRKGYQQPISDTFYGYVSVLVHYNLKRTAVGIPLPGMNCTVQSWRFESSNVKFSYRFSSINTETKPSLYWHHLIKFYLHTRALIKSFKIRKKILVHYKIKRNQNVQLSGVGLLCWDPTMARWLKFSRKIKAAEGQYRTRQQNSRGGAIQ